MADVPFVEGTPALVWAPPNQIICPLSVCTTSPWMPIAPTVIIIIVVLPSVVNIPCARAETKVKTDHLLRG